MQPVRWIESNKQRQVVTTTNCSNKEQSLETHLHVVVVLLNATGHYWDPSISVHCTSKPFLTSETSAGSAVLIDLKLRQSCDYRRTSKLVGPSVEIVEGELSCGVLSLGPI
jgi:hypothetical protein